MSFLPQPEAPGPNPGQPGHYADHEWLTLAVNALDDALLALAAGGGGGGGDGEGGGPIGTVYPFAGDVAPTDHLLCDGTLLSRTTYPTLFSVIGTKYGEGDGATTFAIPDFRDRVPVGASAVRPAGLEGGEELHALTIAEMPNHAHTGYTGDDGPDHVHTGGTGDMSANHSHAFNVNTSGRSAAHSHNVPAGGQVNRAQGDKNTMVPGAGPTVSTTESADHTHNVNGGTDWGNSGHTHAFTSAGANTRHQHPIAAEGSGLGHNVMQPYLAVNYIIRVA